MKRLTSLLAAVAATLALTACFGGGDADPAVIAADPLAAVPDSATQSVSGTVNYLAVLGNSPSETREPIDVTALDLPISDTTEPQALAE